MKARVFVTLKRGVLDPQGQAVADALQRLGFTEVEGVRIGKLVELELKGEGATPADRRARLSRMCEELLRNPVIEDFALEWLEAPGDATRDAAEGAAGSRR